MVTAQLGQEQEANGDNAYAVNVEARMKAVLEDDLVEEYSG